MINISGLQKIYGDFRLHIEELSLDDGNIYGLVGQNGAGKTTLINCLLDLIPYSGSIMYDTHSIRKNRFTILNSVAYVSDRLFFPDDMTGKQVAKFSSFYYNSWQEDTFIDVVNRFSIDLSKRVSRLSQGTRTKLAIAMAIAKQPQYYILDEPTSGLDPIVRIEIISELKKDVKSKGATMLFSTHIMEDLIESVDEIIPIKGGVYSGSINVAKVGIDRTKEIVLSSI